MQSMIFNLPLDLIAQIDAGVKYDRVNKIIATRLIPDGYYFNCLHLLLEVRTSSNSFVVCAPF